MPGGGKPKRIEDTTAKDIWLSLFFGTLIGGVILAASFFKVQPGRLTWTQRIFCTLWLLFWWRRHFVWRRQWMEYQSKKPH